MRFRSLLALAALAGAVVSGGHSASAFDLRSPDLRYHEYERNDALEQYYSYYYSPRGYYPYYNSGEWGGPIIRRSRVQLPPYYGAWGAPNRRYYHVEWHRRHYGGHRRGDW
ncbi:MAG: hypothetical protein QM780_04385 [Hyphomicrobium sp.]|uniref:hypothetical protein n=1 Tax=Hyphomicrobium sp. TaxID=82 RepID=UPI0039E69C9D